MSGDSENEYFSDGIAEEIFNLLAKLPALHVASRTSSFTFRGSKKTAKEIAAALDVDLLLEGSVRKAGNRVRIAMQLIDAEDDAHIWSEIYDHELTDIFDVQAEIAKQVVSAITRGEADPNYAKAWAGLANSSCLLYMWWEASEEHLRTADEASQQALNLDPLLWEAWYLYARACYAAGEMNKAADLIQQAAEVRPDDYQALSLAASAYLKIEEKEKLHACAREQIKRAEAYVALNPGDTRAWGLGACNLDEIGERERGEEWLNKMLKLAPDDVPVLHMAACFYGARGDIENTIHFLERRFEYGDAYLDWMKNDTEFDCVRDDPRFEAMVEQQRIKAEQSR